MFLFHNSFLKSKWITYKIKRTIKPTDKNLIEMIVHFIRATIGIYQPRREKRIDTGSHFTSVRRWLRGVPFANSKPRASCTMGRTQFCPRHASRGPRQLLNCNRGMPHAVRVRSGRSFHPGTRNPKCNNESTSAG